MNSNPFTYYKPDSKEELVHLIDELVDLKIAYALYAGGTELVTMFRQGKGLVDAVIDLKGISELTKVTKSENSVVIGAAVPLNQVIESVDNATIQEALRAIADHTVRNKLTIGGNICGRLPYREAILPMLCRNAEVTVLEKGNLVAYPIDKIFDKRLKLSPNAVLWTIKINTQEMVFEKSQRYSATTEIDYPIVHQYVAIDEEKVKIALSGYSSFPISSSFDFNKLKASGERLAFLMTPFVEHAKSDDRSSADYRLSLLKVCMEDVLEELSVKMSLNDGEGQND